MGLSWSNPSANLITARRYRCCASPPRCAGQPRRRQSWVFARQWPG